MGNLIKQLSDLFRLECICFGDFLQRAEAAQDAANTARFKLDEDMRRLRMYGEHLGDCPSLIWNGALIVFHGEGSLRGSRDE